MSLAVKNVFNKQYGFIEAHNRYSNFYDTMQGSNSRNIQLTLTYNFGKGKGGRKLKRDDNGEAERLNDFNKKQQYKNYDYERKKKLNSSRESETH